MTGEFSRGSIDDAPNEELGSYSREELYEIIGDLHDRIVELQAEPGLECTLTADDLMGEMYELGDELLLQKIKSLSRRVMLWENKETDNRSVRETVITPETRRPLVDQPEPQEVATPDLLESDEVVRIREEFLTEDVLETFASEWVEEFGGLIPTRSILRSLAKDGKFYSYEEVLAEGGLLKFREAIDRLYQPVTTPYGQPENELSSEYPDVTEVVISGKYSRTDFYSIISDLYQKVAKLETQLQFSRPNVDDLTPDDLRHYSKAKLKVKAELLCTRLNELQKRSVGRTAIRKLTEETLLKPEQMRTAMVLSLRMPMEVIRIRERFLQQDMPETMERAAELWRLKFGDELPTETLLKEMYQQCLYFSFEVIEELGGLEELQKAVKYQESVTLHVPHSGEKRRTSREKSPVIWRFESMKEAAEDWREKFPDEKPTRELIEEKHAMGLYATVSMIHRLGGITELQQAVGCDVMEREKRSIDEAKMNMFVEAWDLLFPGEIPTIKLIDEKYEQKLPGWSWRGKLVVDAGGVKEFRRRLEHESHELPTEVDTEIEEVVERLSTGEKIVINWEL